LQARFWREGKGTPILESPALPNIYAQPVDGAKVLRKNQANKWEVKMLCGPEYLSRHGISPQTEAKCMIEIEENGGYLEA
jgi:hypothetical protein